jgi:hypothetical protein
VSELQSGVFCATRKSDSSSGSSTLGSASAIRLHGGHAICNSKAAVGLCLLRDQAAGNTLKTLQQRPLRREWL